MDDDDSRAPERHSRTLKVMSAITQASAQVAKTVAVSTGKVTNAKSMMVWKPHGNKYVFVFDASATRETGLGLDYSRPRGPLMMGLRIGIGGTGAHRARARGDTRSRARG